VLPKLSEQVAVLGLVGGKDELVVDGQMEGIRRLLKGGRVRWKVFENGTHSEWIVGRGRNPSKREITKGLIESGVGGLAR
jgi:hypothetical protein